MKFLAVLIATVLLFSRPNQACKSSRPPPCESNYESDTTAGMAPLYGDSSVGNKNYIVVLNDDVDPENMKNKMSNMRSSGNRRIAPSKALKSSFGINAVVSDLNAEQLDVIRRMDGVKYVNKNGIITAFESTDVWGLDRIDQHYLPLDDNYSPTGDGNGVTVYVVDSGVNTKHVYFGGRAENWHEAKKDKGEDCTGHGTHVAGTVGAATYGVATGVKIRSVRVFGCLNNDNTTLFLVEGLNYILDNGESGSVVSMSLGTSKPDYIVDDAVKKLIQAGFVVVVAAGNNNTNACNTSPARVAEAITVGATDQLDQRAWFSNYGTGVDIFAPGVDVRSLDNATNDGTNLKSGTSMATPHVSGVAAILLSQGIPHSEVRQKILDLSTKDVVGDPKESNNRLLYID